MALFKSGEKKESNELAKTLYKSAMKALEHGNTEFALNEMNEILTSFPNSDEADLVRDIHKEKQEKVKLDQQKFSQIILTTETVTNLEITERLGIISAECVYGMNIFKDIFASVRDVVGGRSSATQNVLKDARKEVLAELRKEAFELAADAVIAVDIDYSEFSGNGKSMLIVVATGTAVKIKNSSGNQ